jgi:hypothetical protein
MTNRKSVQRFPRAVPPIQTDSYRYLLRLPVLTRRRKSLLDVDVSLFSHISSEQGIEAVDKREGEGTLAGSWDAESSGRGQPAVKRTRTTRRGGVARMGEVETAVVGARKTAEAHPAMPTTILRSEGVLRAFEQSWLACCGRKWGRER